MSTAVQLCSRALVMVGANPITALDGTDTSTEATVAAQIYESAIKDLLSRYRWRFASKQEIVVATVGSGVARWEATFDIPADCLVIHALTDEGTKIEFDRYGDKIGANAAADASLVLDYGYRAAESEWPAYFDAYVELHLAAIFAFSIANQLDLSDYLEKKAARAFTFAKTQDTQGRTAKKLDTSRFLQTRGFATGEDDYISSGGSGGSGLTLLIDQIKDGTLPGSSTPIAITNGGTGAATAANARTNLGLGTMAVQNASNVSITGGSITGASITLGTALPISSGGTGATDAATARSNLGLGTIATQAASNVSITGGSIAGITDLAVADGGTGASTAADARTNLGLGSIATQSASSVSITGGSVTGITDLAVADGGTGVSTTPTNGQLLIGNGSGYTVANLTGGSNITISNSAGGITITNNGVRSLNFGTTGLTPATNANGALTVAGTLVVANGGTGATTASDARTNLGLVIGTDVVAQSHVGSGNNAHASFVGATSGTAGVAGFVPAPAAGDEGKFLKGDGSWAAIAGSGTVTSITAGTGLTGGTITTSGTIAIDSTVATLTDTQTLTNKTLTSPTINTASISGGTINNASIGATTAASGKFTTLETSDGSIYPIVGTASTSVGTGTSVDIHSIPSWVKRVTLTCVNVSLSGTDNLLVRLGTGTSGSPSFTASGYTAAGASMSGSGYSAVNATDAFVVNLSNGSRAFSGQIVFVTQGSNIWTSGHFGRTETSRIGVGGGDVTLGSALTQIRLMSSGTNTLDSGTINIQYEG